MPRGRPKGSKNKPKGAVALATTAPIRRRGRPPKVVDNRFTIEAGPMPFTFPIVQEGTVKKPVAYLTVMSESLANALRDAIHWAREWSTTKKANYWPMVKYVSNVDGIMAEKRYAKSMSQTITGYKNYAYTESREFGGWLPLETLEVV